VRLLPLLLVLLCVAPASALANWLTNGDFDVDISGWSSFEPVSYVWDIHDVDANLASGSIILTTTPPPMNPNFHGIVSECVAVTPGEEVYAEAWVNITSAQPGPVQAAIGLQQFSSPTCQPLDHIVTQIGQITNALDQWEMLYFEFPIQPGAITAQVYLAARESAGGVQDPTTTQWDAVALPEPAGSAGLAAGAGLLGALSRRGRERR